MCLRTLGDDLKLVEAQVNRNQRALDDLRKHAGLPPMNGANKGNRTFAKEEGGRIPKKHPKASTAAAAVGGRPKKHCALCGKYSPAIQHTHNTKECRKWNADGTPQGKKEYLGKGNFANTAGRDDDCKQAFAQTQKDMKIMRKMIFQQGKNNKNRLKKCQ